MRGATGTFQELVGQLDYPMFIITTQAGGERAGCLAGFACQCSIDPPRFLVCLSRNNHTYRVACAGHLLAVHLVPREAEELAELFGGRTSDEVDKFARCTWEEGPDGLPVLVQTRAWFVGRVVDRIGLGDHIGHVLEPVDGRVTGPLRQLTFQRVKTMAPGHEA